MSGSGRSTAKQNKFADDTHDNAKRQVRSTPPQPAQTVPTEFNKQTGRRSSRQSSLRVAKTTAHKVRPLDRGGRGSTCADQEKRSKAKETNRGARPQAQEASIKNKSKNSSAQTAEQQVQTTPSAATAVLAQQEPVLCGLQEPPKPPQDCEQRGKKRKAKEQDDDQDSKSAQRWSSQVRDRQHAAYASQPHGQEHHSKPRDATETRTIMAPPRGMHCRTSVPAAGGE